MRPFLAALGGSIVLITLATSASADDPPASAPDPSATAPPASTETAPPPEPPPPPEDPTLTAARLIAQDGLALFDAGRYADALARFDKAALLIVAPTMGLMAARSLVRLGRLVEASERYLAVTGMVLDATASDAFRDAQKSAASERAAVLARIPGVTIALAGAAPGAQVALDGKPLAAARLGASIPVDPGAHVVTVTSGAVTRTERVLLREGEARRIELSLAPPPRFSRPVAAVLTGLGSAAPGVVLGAIAGGLAVSAKGDLDRAGCADATCPPGKATDVDRYNTLIIVSNVGFASALVAGGIGALVVGLPRDAAPAKASWQPWIGPGMAGAVVRF